MRLVVQLVAVARELPVARRSWVKIYGARERVSLWVGDGAARLAAAYLALDTPWYLPKPKRTVRCGSACARARPCECSSLGRAEDDHPYQRDVRPRIRPAR